MNLFTKALPALVLLLSTLYSHPVEAQITSPTVEVTGTATINIIPDRITIEIGMEEYYRHKVFGDSTIVKIPEIEKNVRKTLKEAGVPDSLIVVSDIGNYRDRDKSNEFLMAKRLSATISDFNQLERISEKLDRKGITFFNISKIDNSEMESYNRRGLKAAYDAAQAKAQFLAENSGYPLITPWDVVEIGPNYYDTPAFSNVAFDSGAGMDNMRRIVRRYSVKITYIMYKNSN